jgi:uncharacterized membrane protein
MRYILPVVVLVWLGPLARAAVITTPYITALGSVPGKAQSGDPALSADGSVAAGFVGATSPTRGAFRWTAATGMQPVPFPNDVPSAIGRALSVSGDGSVVVGYYGTTDVTITSRAFAYSVVSGMSVRLDGPPGGFTATDALGASFDGSVVVGEFANFTGFRYTAATGAVPLTPPGGGPALRTARAVSPDGTIVVGGGSTTGYRWTTAGGYTVLPLDATALTPDGSTIVGFVPFNDNGFSTEQAYIWRQASGTAVSLGDLPGGRVRSHPNGISADGSVVVGYSDGGHTFDAFIWDLAHGMRPLKDVLANDYGVDMTGWTLTEATSISADGSFMAGSGTGPNGQSTAWIAFVPEPSSVLLLVVSTVGSCSRRRRAV